jgi:hypothetical protein
VPFASNNRYLCWKVDEAKEKVYEFTEPGVRDRVLKGWRTMKARELARQEAETLAERARTEKKSLAALFGSGPDKRPPDRDAQDARRTPGQRREGVSGVRRPSPVPAS